MSLLAINGGEPVREELLPYGRQYLDQDDYKTLDDFIKTTSFLTTGPTLQKFEDECSKYLGVKHSVALSSATAGLHAACDLLNLSEDDEVIVPAISFAATANCVRYCGGTVVFADVEPETLNLDLNQIKKLITPRTQAIISVDMTGQPGDMIELKKICQKHGLVLIEDAAHTMGLKDPRVGSLCDITVFSFHPVKTMTTGEGGLVVTENDAWAQRLKQFRNHGIEQDYKMREKGVTHRYEINHLGYNYRMTDIQAALGLSQLKKLDWFISRRQEIATKYNLFFLSDTHSKWLQPLEQKRGNAYHLYVIRLKLENLTVDRDEIFKALKSEGIGVNIHYMPIYWHPYYLNLDSTKYYHGLCPQAEAVYQEILSLPIFPGMLDTDIQDVVKALEKVLSHYAK